MRATKLNIPSNIVRWTEISIGIPANDDVSLRQHLAAIVGIISAFNRRWGGAA